ncbi:universal stress protein Slr1101-like [Mercenaria mercenaria]|uniref:universal stress protein Slr1101-like n=1 Tax=Mercenaria mercenaria TaxID=6596 RepID=UPI00234E39E7|nr:universal stress protein Slr1101-like [Mercenaria mercenaria]
MSTEEKKPVLIPMDGSEHADYAFNWYMEHLHKPDHYVVLLHVPERHTFMAGPLGGTTDVESIQLMIQEEEAKEKAFLEKLAQKLKDGGIGGKVKSVAGKPGEVICTVAEDEHAFFIICGSRGKGTFRRTFLGSISDYVLHHSHIPVFICKHKDLCKEHVSSPSLKEKFMNSPLFRRKDKESPKNSPKGGRKKTDSESAE